MEQSLEALIEEARAAFAAAADPTALADAKARFVGRDGELTRKMKQLGTLTGEAKASAGRALNAAKQAIESLLTGRQAAIERAELEQRLAAEAIDVTLPGRGLGTGGLHPVTLTIARIEAIFRSIGFDVADGPEIEEDFFNFTALNTPENHPAR